ncbi:hypothetical protein R1flu_003627 [Riccia fluitans]|uniref:Uncharacterized protein n=1 Tax=Riccia fluitans TaxID=41844 RepID=A0ABD1YCL0_9MARC
MWAFDQKSWVLSTPISDVSTPFPPSTKAVHRDFSRSSELCHRSRAPGYGSISKFEQITRVPRRCLRNLITACW